MSLTVPLEGFGGGGTSLNFAVKAYASEDLLPATAKENTIAVITDTPINSYAFSATEPAEPVDGMVWFATVASSPVEFNALKKNSIQVYPVSVKQYVDGAWGSVTATSYQGGEWVEWWDGYLYKAGDECTDHGGEWISQAIPRTSGGDASARTIKKDSASLSVAGVTNKGCIIRKAEKVDITGKSSLEFTGELYNPNTGGSDYWASICVWSDIGTNAQANVAAVYHQKSGTSSGTLTVDISALDSGEYYVGFALYGTATLTMNSLRAI